jgi:hypothetical protein
VRSPSRLVLIRFSSNLVARPTTSWRAIARFPGQIRPMFGPGLIIPFSLHLSAIRSSHPKPVDFWFLDRFEFSIYFFNKKRDLATQP